MEKKFLLIALSFSLLFLYGCNENKGFQYEFDNFYGTFNTEDKFNEYKEGLNGLGYEIISNNIVKIYTQENSSGFTESIIISKKNNDKDLETYSKENVNNVDIIGLKTSSKGKSIEIKCKENPIKIIYYQGKYSMNQYNLYLSQGFMKIGTEIYTISYATQNEKNRNNFESSFKSIKCK